MVPLDHTLANGDMVEIITGKQPQPSRDWLVPTPASWPRRAAAPRCAAGSASRTRAEPRAGPADARARTRPARRARAVRCRRSSPNWAWRTPTRCTRRSATATLTLAQVAGAIQRRLHAQRAAEAAARSRQAAAAPRLDRAGHRRRRRPADHARALLPPVPPEPIAGYITLGRGVSIHAPTAPILRLREAQPQRVLRWTGAGRRRTARSGRRSRQRLRPPRTGARHLRRARRRAHQHRDDEHGDQPGGEHRHVELTRAACTASRN